MGLIFLALIIFLILTNLSGLALLLQRWFPHYALAKVIGAIGFCLSLFFIEHFIGLGRITWLWPLTTLISLTLIYRHRAQLQSCLWRQEAVFIIGFLAALSWKFTFPNIDAHSEQLTDLALISSYFTGDQLPPWDHWLPDHRLNMYYAFLHYSTALLGRIFGLPIGFAMNFGIVIVLAMIASLIWLIASQFSRSKTARSLLVFAVMAGGTGLAPFTHFLYDQHRPDYDRAFNATRNIWANTRFAGMYDADIDTDFGKQLFPKPTLAPGQPDESRDLPLETIGYLVFLGDLHPPLGGFVLLLLTLGCIVLVETSENTKHGRYLQAVIVASIPLSLITNAWIFPMQILLVSGWIISRHFRHAVIEWRALLSGGALALALCYPFLSQFALNALHTSLGWVKSADHTPLGYFLIIHWPELLILTLAIMVSWRKPVWRDLLITFGIILLFTELIYVNDPMEGKYNRFNSVLKWWSWLYPAVLVLGGAILLGARKVWHGMTVVVLLLVATMSMDLLTYWITADKSARGQLTGDHWLTKDSAQRQILSWLAHAPDGVVLEGLGNGGSYTSTSAMALFAGKSSLTGWPDHEAQWRGNPSFIADTANDVRRFYRGELPDALAWLNMNHVQYIIWVQRDQHRLETGRQLIHEAIKAEFDWRPFWKNGNDEYGIWVRKSVI